MTKENRPRTQNRSIAQRLEALSMLNEVSGCRLWQGATNKKDNGYGVLNVDGRVRYAHRLAWEEVNGPVPAGSHVCHKCDVRTCINPDHMFLGTHADNMADKVAKGRQSKGEEHYASRLTEDDVREIRAAVSTIEKIGERYGVSPQAISGIRCGKKWKHVASPETVTRAVRIGRRGETSNFAKLTADDVRAIRASKATLAELSTQFGVSQPALSLIRNRKTWRHI